MTKDPVTKYFLCKGKKKTLKKNSENYLENHCILTSHSTKIALSQKFLV